MVISNANFETRQSVTLCSSGLCTYETDSKPTIVTWTKMFFVQSMYNLLQDHMVGHWCHKSLF